MPPWRQCVAAVKARWRADPVPSAVTLFILRENRGALVVDLRLAENLGLPLARRPLELVPEPQTPKRRFASPRSPTTPERRVHFEGEDGPPCLAPPPPARKWAPVPTWPPWPEPATVPQVEDHVVQRVEKIVEEPQAELPQVEVQEVQRVEKIVEAPQVETQEVQRVERIVEVLQVGMPQVELQEPQRVLKFVEMTQVEFELMLQRMVTGQVDAVRNEGRGKIVEVPHVQKEEQTGTIPQVQVHPVPCPRLCGLPLMPAVLPHHRLGPHAPRRVIQQVEKIVEVPHVQPEKHNVEIPQVLSALLAEDARKREEKAARRQKGKAAAATAAATEARVEAFWALPYASRDCSVHGAVYGSPTF